MDIIQFKGAVSKFWSYRTAHMTVNDIKMRLHVDDSLHYKIAVFLMKNGHKIDNHICWQVGNIFYQYGDNFLCVGDGVVEGRY